MKLRLLLPTLLASGFLLASCGGGSSDDDSSGDGGYNGIETAAPVNASNADDLAVAATAGAKAAIDQDLAPTSFKPSKVESLVLSISEGVNRRLPTANRTANQEIPNICSTGSVDMQSSSDGSGFTITYNNCTISSGVAGTTDVVANGQVIYKENQDGSSILRYIDFTVTYLGETTSINMTVECDSSNNCSYSSDFQGLDGRTYRVESASVSPSGSGYNVSATVYDPDYGSIRIVANVTYGGCTGGVPVSGSITFTGSNGSTGSVTFNDCDSFTVQYGDSSATYMWADILG